MVDLPTQRRRFSRRYATGEGGQWKNEGQALRFMISRSGLMGKVIADRIGVQESVLSKAQQNDPRARLQEEQIRRLMTVCQSEAWLDYWLFSMGYEPSSRRRIQTELEAENDSLKSQIEAMREEKRIALAWLRDAREAA